MMDLCHFGDLEGGATYIPKQVIIEDKDNYHGAWEGFCVKYIDETHLKIIWKDNIKYKYKIYGVE